MAKPAKNINAQILRIVLGHVWRYPGIAIGMFLAVIVAVIFHQFLPQLVAADILHRLSQGNYNANDFFGSFGSELALYFIICVLGGVVFWRIVIYLLWQLEMKAIRDIRQRIFEHLITQSANFHADHFGGSLVSQSNNLAGGSYVKFVDTAIFTFMPLITGLLATAVILLPRAPFVVLALFVIAIVYITIAITTSRKVRKLNVVETEKRNKQTGLLADVITNIMAVKSFAAAKPEAARYWQAGTDVINAERQVMWTTLRRQTYFSSVGGIMNLLALSLATASVVLWGADVGTVFLVLSYCGLILFQLWDFSNNGLRQINQAFGDGQAMVEILGQSPEVKDPVVPEKPRITRGMIVFDKITFAHADAKKQDVLFSDLRLTIHAGEKIGLVGHSGSGKTTLTKLLLRFADVNQGSITIDGQNIAKLAQDDLRRHIAYVPQEPLLFHRSIAENISYGKPTATEAEIIKAAERANAAEFITKLPNGYQTEVGERGVKLSGGQRQRVAIARALVKDAPVLVLDEATSALDSESERLIQAALLELMTGRTTIVIAHRLSTIQRMDRIVVLEDGRIIEQGSHKDLLAKNGKYAQLWAHQSGGFIEE